MPTGASPTYVVIFDSQQRVLKVSEELRLLLGLESLSEKPVDWQGLVVEDAAKFIPEESGEILRKVGYLKKESGEIQAATISCERIGSEGELVYAEVVLDSVPISKSVGTEIDKDSLDFLTTVSHELRVALNGVIGFTSVLSGTSIDVDQHAILDKLQSCNHMLMGLINDILEYSRTVNSKIELQSETFDLGVFVREVTGLFQEQALSKGLELRIESGAGCDRNVWLPKTRMTQVLSNLIANAIKFTEHGWVSVKVSCDDKNVCIGVQDTGLGVDLNESDSIFRPFFQSNDRGGSQQGTGLGLAISRELVGKMGGTLLLRRPDEGGSLFEMTLPLLESTEGTPHSADPVPYSAEQNGHRTEATKRILVVEDNQLNADILGHFLQDYGVKYDHVDNGRSAVEIYEDGKYDLILMDVMLPEMNGYEATEHILSQSSRKPPVPIVGVTAKVFRRDQVRCIEAGMVEVVHKPVDFKQLREVLNAHLRSNFGDRLVSIETPMFVEEDMEALALEGEEDLSTKAELAPLAKDGLDTLTLEAYVARMKSPDTSREEIVDTAIGIVDEEIGNLLESIDRLDRKDIGMRAHSLKGALALLGARNLLVLAKGLEFIAGDSQSHLKPDHWKEMIGSAYGEFKSQLNDYMRATFSVSD